VVAVAKRFERGPVKSRVGAFPDVLSTTNGRFTGTKSRSEPRLDKSIPYCPLPTGSGIVMMKLHHGY